MCIDISLAQIIWPRVEVAQGISTFSYYKA